MTPTPQALREAAERWKANKENPELGEGLSPYAATSIVADHAEAARHAEAVEEAELVMVWSGREHTPVRKQLIAAAAFLRGLK